MVSCLEGLQESADTDSARVRERERIRLGVVTPFRRASFRSDPSLLNGALRRLVITVDYSKSMHPMLRRVILVDGNHSHTSILHSPKNRPVEAVNTDVALFITS